MQEEVEPPPPLVRYPFESMEINDSFLVACEPEAKHIVANRVRAASIQWGKRHSKRFTTRTVDEGIRVWRVE